VLVFDIILPNPLNSKMTFFISSEQIVILFSGDHYDAHVYGNPCSYDNDNADDHLKRALKQLQKNQKY